MLTEWQLYRDLNWQSLATRMRKPAWVFDARAVADPAQIKAAGFSSWRVGDGEFDGAHDPGHRSCRFHRSCSQSERLLEEGDRVVGLDNLNDYYDPNLKQARLSQIEAVARRDLGLFVEMALEDGDALMALFAAEKPTVVVNLAAQAGVRYSLENPAAYIQSNLVGFCHLLEGCRHHGTEHLVYASSSSVYGGNRNLPFHEQQPVNHPVSLYAASKKANELIAHTYSHLYGLPTTGLRFFTVYGPWGRPDMAPMLSPGPSWQASRSRCSTMEMMQRDFTYIDDIVEGVLRVAVTSLPIPVGLV